MRRADVSIDRCCAHEATRFLGRCVEQTWRRHGKDCVTGLCYRQLRLLLGVSLRTSVRLALKELPPLAAADVTTALRIRTSYRLKSQIDTLRAHCVSVDSCLRINTCNSVKVRYVLVQTLAHGMWKRTSLVGIGVHCGDERCESG